MTEVNTENIDNNQELRAEVELVSLGSKNDARDWKTLSFVKRIQNLPSPLERYFCPRFYLDPDCDQMSDMLILLHSNRVGVVCLAPSHPIVRKNVCVEKVDFQINQSLNRLDNKVTGKHKKGGQRVKKESLLCTIYAGLKAFKIQACIPGALVEVNSRLVNEPGLLTSDPFQSGFIAIILPPFHLESELRTNAYTRPEKYIDIRKSFIHPEFRICCND
ncbi:protein Simiate-like isoform X2 [Varroa jacobsoni]|nr:protein Simiate-like isoform X2 [Varroa destructor]XP_022669293.1 protein Simiate-like isoform X2 [Varroa destructor]XP_022669304.1 protein Simiate-like isoform X2 [Varroa destructor]XP_022669314.1 protein Simiate-like isoform X2 [Varroa destructor]XP_022669323.1 protein Simiate-like isoform X2 [Varroa destructor]XP_022696270.1 protein Simiate-like isoform X2 [Varroa jacobsoni]XP_022696271.1 protein Simiate-like isoform X2 [Varroa jacobsoni]XP_022696273.1 protein Simiate-like isoform X2 [